MSQKQRSRQTHEAAPQPAAPDDDAGLAAVRVSADRLYEIADRAYASIRSVNSEDYLHQNRQVGGQ